MAFLFALTQLEKINKHLIFHSVKKKKKKSPISLSKELETSYIK